MQEAATNVKPGLAPELEGPVVLYDEACGFCRRCVGFCARFDATGTLRFFGQTTAEGRRLVERFGLETVTPGTVVLIERGRLFFRSEAVVRILQNLSRPARWLSLVRWIPVPVRDWAYSRVARWRDRLSCGSEGQCNGGGGRNSR